MGSLPFLLIFVYILGRLVFVAESYQARFQAKRLRHAASSIALRFMTGTPSVYWT
jgi:hypothetical protein